MNTSRFRVAPVWFGNSSNAACSIAICVIWLRGLSRKWPRSFFIGRRSPPAFMYATAALRKVCAFWPRYVYMAGITAGLTKRTRIGDVIFADPSWDWGSGKIRRVGNKETFLPAPYQRRLDESLLHAVRKFSTEEEFLNTVWDKYDGEKPSFAPRVLLGAMASGASVLQSSQAVKSVLKQHKDVLAIEMEAFSVMFACQAAPLPRPVPIVAKAVCDHGNSKKNDNYQAYAAYTSARVFEEFAIRYLSRPTVAE